MNPDNSAAAPRPMLDWLVWTVIHGVVVAGISMAAFYLYNLGLACWIMASAIVAAAASLYLFARDVPGETFMKIILALCVAANAGFLIYNGARAWGAASFNNAQVEKYKAAMGAAAQARTRAVANAIGLGAKQASELSRAFSDGAEVIQAALGFLELLAGMIIFAIGSRRHLPHPTRSSTTHQYLPRLQPGFVAPAQASIPRPRRYARPGPDAAARVETSPNAAPLDALSEKLAKLGAVDPVSPPTNPPAHTVNKAAPEGENNPPTDPPTHPPEAGSLPELTDIKWERRKSDGSVEAWYAPEGGRNRAGKTYLGRIGKRQLEAWQQLAQTEFREAVKDWVEQKRAEKL